MCLIYSINRTEPKFNKILISNLLKDNNEKIPLTEIKVPKDVEKIIYTIYH